MAKRDFEDSGDWLPAGSSTVPQDLKTRAPPHDVAGSPWLAKHLRANADRSPYH